MWKKRRGIFLSLLVCIFVASGCIPLTKHKTYPSDISVSHSIDNPDSRHYIQDVPFVMQKGNLCGPAALSSIFSYFGKNISQEDIARDIYLIPVHGVLNIDLENYAKEKGLWTYSSYDKDLSKIKDFIKKDIPVLALVRSFSIPLSKSYHYLVLLGYEDNEKIFIAHSGKKANETISYSTFLKNWNEAENWSLIACPKEIINWDLDAHGYNNLGILYEKEGDLDTAIQTYRKALDISPEADILFNLGNAYLKKKDFQQAVSCYKHALEINPDFADCYNNLAYTYMEENMELEEATNYVEQALRLKPANRIYYLDTLGMIQLKKGLFDDAIKSFKEASEFVVDKKMSSLVYYHLGLAKLKAGLTEEARPILQKSIELDSESEAKKTLENLL